MQVQYTVDKAIVQEKTVNLALKSYLEKKGIAKNQVAQRISISAPGLHYFLTGVNDMPIARLHEICEVLGIEIRLNGKVSIHEIKETEIKAGRNISKGDVNQLESLWWSINSDFIDLDDFEIPVFELQEYLVESETGMALLLQLMTKTEKARLNDIAAGSSLSDKIRDLHRRNGEIVPDSTRLLELAVRAHIRINIDSPVSDLSKGNFPGGFSWDLKAANEVPF